IADTLEAAQSRGILHPIIKASNVMVTPRGQVKVLDFGSSESSPEQRAEISSFGVLLHQMSTGHVPSDGTDFEHHPSPDLERIIRKCLDKNPERRYASFRELRNDLERLRTVPPPVTVVVTPVETPPVAVPAPRFSFRNWIPETIVVLV